MRGDPGAWQDGICSSRVYRRVGEGRPLRMRLWRLSARVSQPRFQSSATGYLGIPTAPLGCLPRILRVELGACRHFSNTGGRQWAASTIPLAGAVAVSQQQPRAGRPVLRSGSSGARLPRTRQSARPSRSLALKSQCSLEHRFFCRPAACLSICSTVTTPSSQSRPIFALSGPGPASVL